MTVEKALTLAFCAGFTESPHFLFPNSACDFLGERLAGALGLSAAKYQYAIDRYQHDHKVMCSQTFKQKIELTLSSIL